MGDIEIGPWTERSTISFKSVKEFVWKIEIKKYDDTFDVLQIGDLFAAIFMSTLRCMEYGHHTKQSARTLIP